MFFWAYRTNIGVIIMSSVIEDTQPSGSASLSLLQRIS
ncbi:xylose-proton symporter, partial [Salmonella enterica subsp. enterica]|nr:xylose-proton symporter [Salmonella enterica]ECI1956550.1 xylose-proton symporter [Salmonella enterica subsp. enterica serovar Enteritidis]ECJ4470017.1 xylose-proton symporter [Salmonella enterica subsp. enterica serovar Javiana]ECS5539283.1 xylose-proton symporter [Salmonella enterica subsp. enterica serovar Give]ECX2448424.1 xylose-proton symporter [Salmonella enterica subsp. enterica serovar Newport]EDC4398883.1 xylose-proton symporter [Salmonella enterica subsp. enterica]